MTIFKLMTHENQHGYGVSLTKYEDGKLEAGFTLKTFDQNHERLKYLSELASMTGFEIERL